MAKNPYTLLGVKKTASDAEIRKAYRALAKKYHPDVNPGDKKAEEKFKEVTAAYNLLTDKDLRARYDSGQVDATGQQQSPFGGGFGQGFRRSYSSSSQFETSGMDGQDDMADLFSSLFGMNMGGMRGGMNQRRARPQKGADVRYKMKLPFVDALKGGLQKVGPDLKVRVPAGTKDGQVLRLRGKGEPGKHGGMAGDAKIEIEVLPHKKLSRKGNNLYLDLPISLHEALNGAKVTFDMPSGKVQLSIPKGTNSGKKLRLKGKGVKDGDLLITTIITLSEAEMVESAAILANLPDNEAENLRAKLI